MSRNHRQVKTPRVSRIAVLLVAAAGAGCMATGPQREAPAQPAQPASSTPRQTEPRPQEIRQQDAATSIEQRLKELVRSGHAQLGPDEVGYYLDVQQARLQQIGSDRLLVFREGNRILLILPSASGFETGSSELLPASTEVVEVLAKILLEYRATLVSVHGHTDDTGSAAVNQALSARRAMAVSKTLQRVGVDPRRLFAIGHGSSLPVASNDSESGRERNRRVEFSLVPIVR